MHADIAFLAVYALAGWAVGSMPAAGLPWIVRLMLGVLWPLALVGMLLGRLLEVAAGAAIARDGVSAPNDTKDGR